MANTQRATCWSLTINNPGQLDEECIALARQKGWQVVGQKERGQQGTEHYQLMLRTPQVRFSAVKKQFPRAHIEVARNSVALEQYVQKEDTRAGGLPSNQNKYPSFSKFIDLIYDYYTAEGEDGFDYVLLSDGVCRFYKDENEQKWACSPLLMLDRATRHLIKNGYYVEQIAGNPAIRSQWKLFWREMMVRSFQNKQTLDIGTQQANDTEIDWTPTRVGSVLEEASFHEESSSEGSQQDHSESGSQYCEGGREA